MSEAPLTIRNPSVSREALLRALRQAAGERRRLRYLDGVLPLLHQRLREMKRDIYGSVRVTQSWAFLPAGGGIADPTAAIAGRAADLTRQKEYRDQEARLRALSLERETLRRRQEILRCQLNALDEEQRFLVELRLLEGRSWPDTERLMENRSGIHLHRDTLRRRLEKALEALEQIMDE